MQKFLAASVLGVLRRKCVAARSGYGGGVAGDDGSCTRCKCTWPCGTCKHEACSPKHMLQMEVSLLTNMQEN